MAQLCRDEVAGSSSTEGFLLALYNGCISDGNIVKNGHHVSPENRLFFESKYYEPSDSNIFLRYLSSRSQICGTSQSAKSGEKNAVIATKEKPRFS